MPLLMRLARAVWCGQQLAHERAQIPVGLGERAKNLLPTESVLIDDEGHGKRKDLIERGEKNAIRLGSDLAGEDHGIGDLLVVGLGPLRPASAGRTRWATSPRTSAP